MKKKEEKQKVAAWKWRFGKALQQLSKKNIRYSEEEVAEDVNKAVCHVFPGKAIVKQLVSQIPWGTHLKIGNKLGKVIMWG